MPKYEAVYYPGEEDRLPSWSVVEWTVNNKVGRIGRTVEDCGCSADAEEAARDIAYVLNASVEQEIYAEFG